MNFNRVAVIGISGSGKSTFASVLAARTGLPLLHGDQLEWQADWTLRPEPDLHALHARWMEQPRWIIEGWMDPARTERLTVADIVIDLDPPTLLCAWRVLSTVLLRKERPYIDDALKAATLKEYARLRTRREVADWLTSAAECWRE